MNPTHQPETPAPSATPCRYFREQYTPDDDDRSACGCAVCLLELPLPCPFCAKRPGILHLKPDHKMYRCLGCLIDYREKSDWNTRPESTALRAELEQAKKKVEYVERMGLQFGMMKTSDKPEPYLAHTWAKDSDHERMFREWSATIGWETERNQLRADLTAARAEIERVTRERDEASQVSPSEREGIATHFEMMLTEKEREEFGINGRALNIQVLRALSAYRTCRARNDALTKALEDITKQVPHFQLVLQRTSGEHKGYDIWLHDFIQEVLHPDAKPPTTEELQAALAQPAPGTVNPICTCYRAGDDTECPVCYGPAPGAQQGGRE